MKVIVAPDSFKGSLSSVEVADAIEQGVNLGFPDCEVVKIPLADGGEGTCEILLQDQQAEIVKAYVCDPLMRKIESSYAVLNHGKTALIEMAKASGLTLLSSDEYNPLHASTFGTGELIKDALDRGCRDFVIGIGGSATNDAGTGLLRALGFHFLDVYGHEVSEGGENLSFVVSVDESKVHPALMESKFLIATDVSNPFSGVNGAAQIYAPQKGANEAMVDILDSGLESFRQLILKDKNINLNNIPGAGAAGGVGGGLFTYLNADLQSGINIVLKKIQFEQSITNADLIITGEGKLDAQTLQGKVPMGVLSIALQHNIPVIAIGGSLHDVNKLGSAGFLALYSILQQPMHLKRAMQPEVAKRNIQQTVEQFMRVIRLYR